MLAPQSVDVHVIRVTVGDDAAGRLQRVLSDDEAARARAFRSARDARAFVASRAALRGILARCVGADPAALRFAYGPNGKPSLRMNGAPHFNLAHSGDIAVVAVCADGEVGIDVERVRRFDELSSVAARFFCAEETLALGALPEAARELAFFRCWTRKEAYLKAVGDGLPAALETVRVSVDAGEGARFLAIDGDAAAAQRWTLHDVPPAPGYAGALAYEGARRRLRVQPIRDADALLA